MMINDISMMKSKGGGGKQGKIHGYRSRVRVGRGSDKEG